MKHKFSGTGVALATPLNKDYSVDYDGLSKLLEHTIAGHADYLVVMGTTAESPVFSWTEKLTILDFILKQNKKRKPVVFGLGGNYTQDLIDRSKDLERFDIDAILSVSPYYNRPSQGGLLRHFTLLADAFPKPIILYNVPARTASNVSAETTLALSTHENIIAMKEASGDMKQIEEIIANKPEGFLVLSGEDRLTLEMIEKGADGVISVIGNLLPFQFTRMVNAALSKESEAQKMDQLLHEAYVLLSEEGNPTSLKTGLDVLEICSDTVKPPLIEGSQSLRSKWIAYLSNLKQ